MNQTEALQKIQRLGVPAFETRDVSALLRVKPANASVLLSRLAGLRLPAILPVFVCAVVCRQFSRIRKSLPPRMLAKADTLVRSQPGQPVQPIIQAVFNIIYRWLLDAAEALAKKCPKLCEYDNSLVICLKRSLPPSPKK
jgi:hypothetical protein